MMKRDLTSLLGERLLTADTAPASTGGSSGQDGDSVRGAALAANNQCMSCHKPSETGIGPSLAAIAQRYDNESLRAALQRKINQGARGGWGAIPAPAMGGIPEADVPDLSRWVTSFR